MNTEYRYCEPKAKQSSKIFNLDCSVAALLAMTFLSLTLVSCKVGPNYHAPNAGAPDKWNEAKQAPQLDKKSLEELEWWKRFNDDELNKFIEKGLAQNYDLKIAKAHITGARAAIASARSALFPTVGASANYEREANMIVFGDTTFPKPFNIFQAGFDAAWELDLFGSSRRALESYEALFGATLADRDNIRISVLAEIARTYMNIRRYEQQVRIANDTVEAEKNNARIRDQLYKAGETSATESLRANSAETQAEAQALYYQNFLNASEYAMDLLVAEKPGFTHKELTDVKPVPVAEKSLVLAAPAEVVRNRPDIHAAERRLASATADIGAAEAKLFPDISLSAFFGFLSSKPETLIQASSKAWTTSAGVNWPVLNYSNWAKVDISKAQQAEALTTYKKVVQAALVEVESALSTYNKQEDARTLMEKNVKDNTAALEIANKRFKVGLIPLTEVLDAQKALFAAESQLADAAAASSQDLIAVYKSLGGGWKAAGADENKPATEEKKPEEKKVDDKKSEEKKTDVAAPVKGTPPASTMSSPHLLLPAAGAPEK